MGGCLSRLVFVKVSRQCVSVVLVIFVFSCYDVVCEFSERLVADCVQLHVVWGARLGIHTGMSDWAVRLWSQAGMSVWVSDLGVGLRCQAGMSG